LRSALGRVYEEIPMKSSKTFRILGLTLGSAALTFTLAVCAQAQTVTLVYDFHAIGKQADATSIIQGTDGNLYGTATGGTHDQGQIFRMTPSGDLTAIYNFCAKSKCPDGSIPETIILGSDGDLYGVTYAGGSDAGFSLGSGTVYKITPGGELTTLHTFCPTAGCADGQGPRGITLANDGNFYGTTQVGGAFSQGTLFSISPTGTFKTLHTFCSQSNCSDGGSPQSPPVQGIDGNFYGVAYSGGTLNGGTIYQITAAGTYKVLYNFCSYQTSCPTGSNPSGALAQDSVGNFFGTTAFGGHTINYGTVFEFTSEHQYKVLHKFQGSDGNVPQTELAFASNGEFYGVTQGGGGPREGNIYKVTSAGVFDSFFAFQCCNEGYDPVYSLFQSTNGLLYGATNYGTNPCCYGTIFSVDDNMSPLVETVPVAGKVGKQIIILGNGLTGSSSVKFGGVKASFTVESDTYIKATVPSGARTGTVSVVTPSGTLNSNPQFVVTK
jgi:uncharacterized repeat protein (TIGR03803 family)